jgi:DNA polymerase-3 subunit gamma/tau
MATSLLGYTPSNLLDETVDALAAHDGATLFGVVDKVVDTGQDPRRFAEDLLHRLRDLVVVSAVPDAASRGLIELSDDQSERLTGQAGRFGRAELTRAADIVSTGLTEMRGATAPRLLLEIMLARVLLPGADDTAESLGARIDRLERRMSVAGADVAPGTPAPERSTADVPRGDAAPTKPPAAPAQPTPPAADDAVDGAPQVEVSEPPQSQPPSASEVPAAAAAAAAPAARFSLVDVRQLWPGVLDRVKSTRRYAWVLLSQNAHVQALDGDILTIGMVNAGARDSFTRSGADEILRQALIDELGVDWRVEAIVDAGTASDPKAAGRERSPRQRADDSTAASRTAGPPSPPETGAAQPSDDIGPPDWAVSDPAPTASADAGDSTAAAEPDTEAEVSRQSLTADAQAAKTQAAKAAVRPMRAGGKPAVRDPAADESEVSDDDSVVDDGSLSDQELLARELGAEVIEDLRHDAS